MATTKNMTTDKTAAKGMPAAAVEKGASEDAWKGLPADSQLISFGERFTFTFAQGREVGSIHFDRGRGEIFYKGHNIRNMDLEDWQMQVLEGLRKTLTHDEQGKAFAQDYARTLDKIVMEKKNRNAGSS
ncbi:MAG TPA: hypothetical protein VFX30_11345 [bacterium]|nr:hypothetical protein [bacterium]